MSPLIDPGRRHLLVSDVDSTFIQDEVIELIAVHAGTRDQVTAVTDAAMRGELDFAQSLYARVATLAGLPAGVLDEVRAAVRLTPGAADLVAVCRAADWPVALVSGGFVEIVQPIADDLGITHVRANRLEIVDNRLTGRVLGAVIDRAAKAEALREFAAAQRISVTDTVAIGDGANDLDMFAAAGLSIAFAAKPAVRDQADVALDGPGLDAVLPLIGLG